MLRVRLVSRDSRHRQEHHRLTSQLDTDKQPARKERFAVWKNHHENARVTPDRHSKKRKPDGIFRLMLGFATVTPP